MDKFLDFLNTFAGKTILITVCVSVVVLLIVLLIRTISKHKKSLKIVFGRKNKDDDDQRNETPQRSVEDLKAALFSHKFFSTVKVDFVSKDYNFSFNLYDTLIEHGVKKEDKNLVDFKKLIASKFLSDCLFKYLYLSTENWINEVLSEYSGFADKTDPFKNPVSICNIVSNLVHFTKETSMLAGNVKLNYNGKIINGIPADFTNTFCKTVNDSISSIQYVFSSVVYMSGIPWQEKMFEILDIYELALVHIHHCVDSTLAILNGQMEKYVNELITK